MTGNWNLIVAEYISSTIITIGGHLTVMLGKNAMNWVACNATRTSVGICAFELAGHSVQDAYSENNHSSKCENLDWFGRTRFAERVWPIIFIGTISRENIWNRATLRTSKANVNYRVLSSIAKRFTWNVLKSTLTAVGTRKLRRITRKRSFWTDRTRTCRTSDISSTTRRQNELPEIFRINLTDIVLRIWGTEAFASPWIGAIHSDTPR